LPGRSTDQWGEERILAGKSQYQDGYSNKSVFFNKNDLAQGFSGPDPELGVAA